MLFYSSGEVGSSKRYRPYPGLISEGTAAVPAKDDFQGWRGKTVGSSLGSLCSQHLGRVEAGLVILAITFPDIAGW